MFGRSFLESWRWFQHVTHISLGSWSLQFQNGKKEIAWGTLRVPISAVMYLWKMSVYWYSNVVIPFSRYELGGLQHRSPSNSCFWEPQRGVCKRHFLGACKGVYFWGFVHNFKNVYRRHSQFFKLPSLGARMGDTCAPLFCDPTKPYHFEWALEPALESVTTVIQMEVGFFSKDLAGSVLCFWVSVWVWIES